MKKIYYLLAILMLTLIACHDDEKTNLEKEHLNILNNSIKLSKIKNKVIKNGDIKSYNKLISYYVKNQNINHELLTYSILMVEKYKYYRACSYIYISIINTYNNGVFDEEYFEELNPEIKKITLYYLNLGARNDNIECQIDLQFLYEKGIGLEKNNKISDSLKIIINEKNKMK
ncbi:hypothetical protein [Flavobacterium sp.]|uniref:hypothetical protein n=1 Tax=Flavobacterium sp. TaxID=239 RepID=UPI003752227B